MMQYIVDEFDQLLRRWPPSFLHGGGIDE